MEYAIEMLNITKEFPGIVANDDVTIKVEKGTIHALLGENGAGKSTLMSILFGMYQPTKGEIRINGKTVNITDPNVANDLGIGMVHQHFKLVDIFTVTENIVLGREGKKSLQLMEFKNASKKIKELGDRYGLKVDPNAKIQDISVGMQQRVEILKMLYRDADILIFDEPTAVLTPQEIDELMQIMKNLKKEGKTILLITHKLKEIKAVADVCTVLRRGKVIDTVNVADVDETQMAKLMVGRDVEFKVDKKDHELGDVILDVHNLHCDNARGLEAVKGVSFNIRGGEILGIAGIDGNGQSELVYALTGLSKVKEGQIILNGQDITHFDVRKHYDAGLAHVPEDRQKHGLILDFKLKENYIVHNYDRAPFSKHGILNNKAIDDYAKRLTEEFDVRSGQGIETTVRSMSGGNQQKAIVAREVDRSSDLLIVVQPTRGLDVGAIEYIHNRIVEERNKGKAVLLVSFELDEIMSLSDRIAVMFSGEITGVLNSKETNEHELGLLMAGAERKQVVTNE